MENRRTMCAHCSLRQDLPGFIDREHAEGNRFAIEQGELFPCHMAHDPTDSRANRICLGAALAAQVPLGNSPAKELPEVYDSLDHYVETQAGGRRTNVWLEAHADKWYDRQSRRWWGWWAQAPAGNWHYLMITREGNEENSVYLFHDQCQELFGPLELWGPSYE